MLHGSPDCTRPCHKGNDRLSGESHSTHTLQEPSRDLPSVYKSPASSRRETMTHVVSTGRLLRSKSCSHTGARGRVQALCLGTFSSSETGSHYIVPSWPRTQSAAIMNMPHHSQSECFALWNYVLLPDLECHLPSQPHLQRPWPSPVLKLPP